jgi:hypothetical protein
MDSIHRPISALLLSSFFILTPLSLNAQGIRADKTIRVKLQQEVKTKSALTGDAVSALLMQPLMSEGIVAPAGSRLEGRVDFVQEGSFSEDGWMRLLFNRITLPDGREIHTIALASFYKPKPHPKRDHVLWIAGLGAVGLLLGGHNERVTAGLGGALAGLVLAENRSSVGRNLTLRAGQTIRIQVNEDTFRER